MVTRCYLGETFSLHRQVDTSPQINGGAWVTIYTGVDWNSTITLLSLLCKACELHTVCHSTGNPTIDTCFDADRLDLMRVGITPDPEKMATERGKFYAANMEQFYAATGTNEEYYFFDEE